MDMETLEEQLLSAADEESEENAKNVAKIRKIVQRRLKNLQQADYQEDEIIFGGAMAICELLNKIEASEREHVVEIVCRIVKA